MLVEGFFTGVVEKKNFGDGAMTPLMHFRVLRMRPGKEIDGRPSIVRPAIPDFAAALVALTAAAKPFFLVTDSFPLDAPDAKKKADQAVEVLKSKGFPDAEAVDTTAVPGLFCCHLAIVVSRHADEKEALAAAALAQKTKKVVAAVRRAF
jgi:hypothetical protein